MSCFPALEYIRLSNNSKLELQPDTFASNPRLKCLLCQRVKAKELLGISAQTKKNLSWVAFSLFAEKSPLTICRLLQGMDRLGRVEVRPLVEIQHLIAYAKSKMNIMCI